MIPLLRCRSTRRFFLPMRGGHTCSWWRCSQRTCTAIPRLDMKNRHTLDGLAVPSRYFQSFLDQFGSHVFRHGVANNSFRAGGTVTACRVHESFPGVNMGDVTHQFLGRGICCEVPFGQVGATCQVGGRHGGAGLKRYQALLSHEPAHRLWTGCNAIAFQGFVDPSITGGFVWSR